MNDKFLIETALLTHGLKSIENRDIAAIWPWEHRCLAWVDGGKVQIGNIEEFLSYRKRANELIRIDKSNFEISCSKGLSGALTASGTMLVAEKMKMPIAVTAGMGGIGDIIGEEICVDLPSLKTLDVSLIATSPKDVVDIEESIKWLLKHGVSIWGKNTEVIDGFLVNGKPVPITGKYNGQLLKRGMLLLNPIPSELRLKDLSIIEKAKIAGKEAEKKGEYYHPAANAMIDRLSLGRSSRLQLQSLINNSLWAHELTQIK